MSEREPNSKVMEEWNRRRQREWINLVPAVFSLGVIAWISKTLRFSVGGFPSILIAAVAMAVISLSFVYAWFNWRCPACNKLPGHAFDPKFCTECGIRLR